MSRLWEIRSPVMICYLVGAKLFASPTSLAGSVTISPVLVHPLSCACMSFSPPGCVPSIEFTGPFSSERPTE